MEECSSITSTMSSPSTLRSGLLSSSTMIVSRIRLASLAGGISRTIRSCLTTLSLLGLLLTISVLRLRLVPLLRLRRLTTTSSSCNVVARMKPEPLLAIHNNQIKSRKPATLPRTMPATVPGAGPELRPSYCAGIAITTPLALCRGRRDRLVCWTARITFRA